MPTGREIPLQIVFRTRAINRLVLKEHVSKDELNLALREHGTSWVWAKDIVLAVLEVPYMPFHSGAQGEIREGRNELRRVTPQDTLMA